MSARICVESGVVCRNLSCATACMLRTERATPPAPAQPASAEQQPVAWFSPEQMRAMTIVQAAAKALEEGTFTTPPALHEAMDALSAVYRFGTDTLSGRADGGPDDRGWYRESVLEMTRRARAGLDALRAAIGEGEGN